MDCLLILHPPLQDGAPDVFKDPYFKQNGVFKRPNDLDDALLHPVRGWDYESGVCKCGYTCVWINNEIEPEAHYGVAYGWSATAPRLRIRAPGDQTRLPGTSGADSRRKSELQMLPNRTPIWTSIDAQRLLVMVPLPTCLQAAFLPQRVTSHVANC